MKTITIKCKNCNYEFAIYEPRESYKTIECPKCESEVELKK